MDATDPPIPYRSTPIFDETTLPSALRRDHATKEGVWGVIRVLESALRLEFGDGSPDQRLSPGQPGLLLPAQPHWVEPLGAMRMQIDFYDEAPRLSVAPACTDAAR